MKKAGRKTPLRRTRAVAEDDILSEYNFSQARPNPYADRIARDAVMVVLDPDVARLFPDAVAVNEALRALARIAERTSARPRSKKRSA
jgi:hypothetical protein